LNPFRLSPFKKREEIVGSLVGPTQLGWAGLGPNSPSE